jgi:predicted O-methyltransferase YrrM
MNNITHQPVFSYDWQTPNFPTWERVLPVFDMPLSILEIGCYEGRSTLWFLNRYPDCRIACLDTFEGGLDHKQLGVDFSGAEARFHANVLRPHGSQARLLHGSSFKSLIRLNYTHARFNLILIDGSHLAADVLSDAVLSWPLLVKGGVMIFDDYGWGGERPPHETPRPAIDAFLACHKDRYTVLEFGYQVIVQRL